MDIELHEGGDNGHSSEGFGSRNSTDCLGFEFNQPCDETVESSTTDLLVGELLQRVNDLRARVECLENRLPAPHRAEPAFDTDVELQRTKNEFDDLDEVADTEPEQVGREDGGPNLSDLPRGPLSIEVVATALSKTPRTIRGWSQVEKYGIPCHKEGGRWHYYRDELMAWYSDYEAISRRDARSAQSKRRRTRNGM